MGRRGFDRIGHKARGFDEALAWESAQLRELTLEDRLRIARELRERVWGRDAPDVREAERRA